MSPAKQQLQFNTDRNFAFSNYKTILLYLKSKGAFTDKKGRPVQVNKNAIDDFHKILVTLWRLAHSKDSQWRCANGLTATGKTGECRHSYDSILEAIAQNFPDDYSRSSLMYRIGQLHRAGLINHFQQPKPGHGMNIPGAKKFFGYGRNFGRSNNWWKVISVIPLRCIEFLKELSTLSQLTSLWTIFHGGQEIQTQKAYWLDMKSLWSMVREKKIQFE